MTYFIKNSQFVPPLAGHLSLIITALKCALAVKRPSLFALTVMLVMPIGRGGDLSVSVLNVVGQARSQVLCRWSGFTDPESPITSFTFFVGTAAGLHDVIEPVTLAGYVTRYPAGTLVNSPQTARICSLFVNELAGHARLSLVNWQDIFSNF